MIFKDFFPRGVWLFGFVTTFTGGRATEQVHECGELRIEEPAILGRDVTFTFTPSFWDEGATFLWQRTNKWNPWAVLKKDKFTQYEHNCTYYLVLNNTVSTSTKDDAIYYRVQYYNSSINCTMETPKLELNDISGENCGLLYLRTQDIVHGEKVEIEYYPKKEVLGNQEDYVRQWKLYQETAIISLQRNLNGSYEEKMMTNDKYVFTIFSYNASMNGNYKVMCDDTGSMTNEVTVILPVAPNMPEFENLMNIENCTECMVGDVGDEFHVFCKIVGGTEPITVKMIIGNESLKVTKSSQYPDKRYKASVHLQERHHAALINCSVINDALDSPLTVTANVYVKKPPTLQQFRLPDLLKEGDAVNIECKFTGGRPAPALSFKLTNTTLPTQQNNTFNTTDQSYSSVIFLTKFERRFNGQNISCCWSSKWYTEKHKCHTNGPIEYLFPPSEVNLKISTKNDDMPRLYATCTIYGSNPVCKPSWNAPTGSMLVESSARNDSGPYGAWTSAYVVVLDTIRNYTGEAITCAANCSYFNTSLQKVAPLPYAPVIEFNTSGSVLELPLGATTHVKCTARSSPLANISWIEQKNGGQGPNERELTQCFNATECIVSIEGYNVSQMNISCITNHLLGPGRRNLIISVFAASEKDSLNQEDTISWILAGSVAGLAVVVVTVAVIVKKKLAAEKDKLATNQAIHNSQEDMNRYIDANELHVHGEDSNRVGTNKANGDGGTPRSERETTTLSDESSDNVLYSQICKPRKTNTAEAGSRGKQQLEDGQLLYADLDLKPPGSLQSKGVVVRRRDSPTEYVCVDFVKTADLQKIGGDDSKEVDNIYANQT